MKQFLLAFICIMLLTDLRSQDAREANYDEAKVPPYSLPDALMTLSGKKVSTKSEWEKTRRPEILSLFETNIYGRMPKSFDAIKFSVSHEDDKTMNGRARMKEVVIEVFRNNTSVQINLLLFIPRKATKPVPVFLLINNRGKEITDPSRKTKSAFWPAEMLIDSGYAIAAIQYSDMAPDDKEKYVDGVLRLYPEQLTADDGMKAVGAWAWGASRVMDYFLTDKSIDAKKVAIVGHSRGGKASLWAAAEDQRFAICFSNCSGNTGAALSRRQFGERINRINTIFPHWFDNNYKRFNNRENDLPVDQHMLIALIAPRPVYATNATRDLWADPIGTYLSLKNAENVYALYGLTSNLPANPPAVNTPVTASPLGYHIRDGIHDLTEYDWQNFIRFAKYQYAKVK
ncbi:MAG: hypothetical protein ABI151_08700 [Chitinophagaceae bacterium]